MKHRTIEDTMLFAAKLIEREGHFSWYVCDIPKTCDDVGCVLGWIGFALGVPQDLDVVAQAVGYAGSMAFYNDMDRRRDHWEWTRDAKAGADTLRALAHERMQAAA